MIKTETILNRFQARYGNIIDHNKIQNLMIAVNERFGLTFQHDKVLQHFIKQWDGIGELDFQKVLPKDIFPFLLYNDYYHSEKIEVEFDERSISTGLRVLDSI